MTEKLKNNHEHLGHELDWVAVDDSGRLAVFQSAGHGPIPERYEPDPDFDLLDKLEALPVTGDAKFVKAVDYNTTEVEKLAQRGFFAFDWLHQEGQYQLIAEPTEPLRLDALVAANVIEPEMVVQLGQGFSDYC